MKHRSLIQLAAAIACAAPSAGAAAPEPTAEGLLDAALQTYRALQTYEDEWTLTYDMVLEDPDAMEMFDGADMQTTLTLAFARPNRIALVSEQFELYCDGVHLWKVMPMFGQFTKETAPETLDEDVIGMPLGGGNPIGDSPHPVLELLVSSRDSFKEAMPDITLRGEAVEEQLDGRPGHRIPGQMQLSGMMLDASSPCSIWVDAETRLIRQIRVDVTSATNAMADEMREAQGEDEGEDAEWMGTMPRYEKLEVIMTATKVIPDAVIPPDRFVFDNEAEYEEAEEFSWDFGYESDQQELVGHPAPEFTGRDIDGAELSLTGLKGRVVVLDFWATWCGPCVQAIPHVQALAERFADQPVTVLGINRDMPGSEERVRRFLEKKEITFRQVMDVDGEIAGAYRVQGIPCTVVIDREGVLQFVQTGFLPGQEDDMAEDIDRLLAGESLFDPEEVARRAERREERTEGAEAPTTTAGVESVAPERLADAGTLRGQFQGYQARAIDVDGDGRREFVMPGWQGGAEIIAADGLSSRRVRFHGLPSQAGISSLEPVELDGQLHWLVIAQQWGYSGRQRVWLALFDADGEPVWKYHPDLPEKVSGSLTAAAGDLDDDGEVEFVVGLSTYKQQSSGRNSWAQMAPKAYLLVLDRAGAVLSLRRAGRSIEAVWVAEPPEAGGPRAILCVGDGRVRRYHLTDGAADEAADAPGLGH